MGVADTGADAELLLDLNIDTHRASVPEGVGWIPSRDEIQPGLVPAGRLRKSWV